MFLGSILGRISTTPTIREHICKSFSIPLLRLLVLSSHTFRPKQAPRPSLRRGENAGRYAPSWLCLFYFFSLAIPLHPISCQICTSNSPSLASSTLISVLPTAQIPAHIHRKGSFYTENGATGGRWISSQLRHARDHPRRKSAL